MRVLRGGGKGNEVLYDSAAVIKWYAERDAEIENEKLRREVEELLQASETELQPGTIEYERHRLKREQRDVGFFKGFIQYSRLYSYVGAAKFSLAV